MAKFLSYESDGATIFVEVDPEQLPQVADRPLRASTAGIVEGAAYAAAIKLDAALGVIRPIANAFVAQAERFDREPSEAELSFGLEVAGEAGFLSVAKGSAKAVFSVKVKWSGLAAPRVKQVP